MNHRTHRAIAGLGLVLLLGVPASWIGVLIGMFRTFGEMSGDISQAASQITSGVAMALWSAAIGQSVALAGLSLLLIALFAFKVREPWVMKWGRYLMLPWLILFPVGTAAGVLMLVYFSRHREEFTGESGWPNKTPLPTPVECPPSNHDQVPGAADL